MRVGREGNESGGEFLVSAEPGKWIGLSALGVAATDLPAVISRSDDIRERLEAETAAPITAPALACPVVRPSKIVAIGLNYRDHIEETGMQAPERPVVFSKFPNALTGPTDPIVLDTRLTEMPDYEVELAVVIGRRTRWCEEADALGSVFGYAVANDVSARDWQRRDGQFDRSKGFDTFCPIGPWITTADAIADPQDLPIRSWVGGEPRQQSNTKEMVFSVASLVAFLSRGMTLEPGDVILTGTPAGVGLGMDPPRWLAVGDVVSCEIDGLGRIENAVVAPSTEG